MARERKNDPTTVEELLTGDEQMIVHTVGFGIYPTDAGFPGLSCDGVAFPRVGLLRHRPLLLIPKEQVEYFDGPFPVVCDEGWMVFDLTGYSASFKGQEGLTMVIAADATQSGNFPSEVKEDRLDFNLVPDAHSFNQGLVLSPQWRQSPELLASFTFLPGHIGGLPDDSTNDFTSRWGFTEDEMAKMRRKTNVTVHVSKELPADAVIELCSVATKTTEVSDPVGSIRVKPNSSTKLVTAVLMNGWVDEAGAYDPDTDRNTVNLSHVDAMLKFCEPVPHNTNKVESIKIDFGRKEGERVNQDAIVTAAQRVFARQDRIASLTRRIINVVILYNSDISCAGRQMRMSK